MKTFSPAYKAHIARTLTTKTRCSRVEKSDGTFVLSTELDRDVVITTGPRAGVYPSVQGVRSSDTKATSDMSITNMELVGVISDPGLLFGFKRADIEANLFDTAPVEVFELNYEDPDDYQDPLVRGFMGEIRSTAEGAATFEYPGALAKASQTLGRTDGDACDVVRFGDVRCGKDLSTLHRTGTVTAVTTRRLFTVAFDAPISAVGVVRVWDEFPFDIEIGDAVDAIIGCDRTFGACLFHERTVSFRGHGHWAPGISAIVRAVSPEPARVPEVAVTQTLAFGELTFTSGENEAYPNLIQRVDF